MQGRHSAPFRRGLTLIETAAAIASLGLLGTVGVAGVSASRQVDAHANCSARQAAIGAGNAQFALATNDSMFGFTWQQSGASSAYPDLNALQATSQNGAHIAQAIDILRRRGRPDIPVLNGWIPDTLYSHLALLDFQDRTLADTFNVCPSDDNLNKWRRWPSAFAQGQFRPAQPDPTLPMNFPWVYTSSYSVTASAFDVNQSVLTVPATSRRMSQHMMEHSNYFVPTGANLGPSSMATVALPSQKTHLFDTHQRHLPGNHLYFMYTQATLPILFFDGSVRVKRSGDAQRPWNPQLPGASGGTGVYYAPAAWEPPTALGTSLDLLGDRYRFTRDGLLGWDFQN